MRNMGVDLRGALFEQRIGRIAQRATGIDNIVNENATAPVDVADHVHDFRFPRPLAPLIDNSEWRADALGKAPGADNATNIR
ncbi:hypothetical protein MnTg02_01177 [bacterium MnTg02]|nr:hypothetical protein MnTg02_01177 [bacterium MnTg02]